MEMVFYGRGGQGIVTAAEITALAAIKDEKYALSRPVFGAERRGAPTKAYVRISSKPILARYRPESIDLIMVLDSRLFKIIDLTSGLKRGGWVVVNTSEVVKPLRRFNIAAVDATSLALKFGLGSPRDPIVNTSILGALAHLKIVTLESLLEAVKELSPAKQRANINAVKEGLGQVKIYYARKDGIRTSKFQPTPNDILRKKAQRALLRKIRKGKWPTPVCLVNNMHEDKTGTWRSTGRPILSNSNRKKCSRCGLCQFFCPEDCILQDKDGCPKIDYDFCKGCGICAKECPKKLIEFEEES